ncbi:sirtuin family protein [Kipferlia bialata]|uniref:Sirtuin family protein n=1 Tax=Kipferlia bialata TaxID=797122 RepID=A0A9K3CRP6_9EUKA|nr:sirtuin family protein [Kipferlia bialata]|eukprot:g1165.t1
MFDLQFLLLRPRPFYDLARTLFPDGTFKPTDTHVFLRLLHDKGIIKTIFTQNIDNLEELAGISPEVIVHAHGSFLSAGCVGRRTGCPGPRKAPLRAVRAATLDGAVPHCPFCGVSVKPDITFFGEPLPTRVFKEMPEVPKSDMIMVAGTSLKVTPMCYIAAMSDPNHNRVLLNREPAGFIGRKQPLVKLYQKYRPGHMNKKPAPAPVQEDIEMKPRQEEDAENTSLLDSDEEPSEGAITKTRERLEKLDHHAGMATLLMGEAKEEGEGEGEGEGEKPVLKLGQDVPEDEDSELDEDFVPGAEASNDGDEEMDAEEAGEGQPDAPLSAEAQAQKEAEELKQKETEFKTYIVPPSSDDYDERHMVYHAVNLTRNPKRDTFIPGNCDDSVNRLVQQLGWGEEFDSLKRNITTMCERDPLANLSVIQRASRPVSPVESVVHKVLISGPPCIPLAAMAQACTYSTQTGTIRRDPSVQGMLCFCTTDQLNQLVTEHKYQLRRLKEVLGDKDKDIPADSYMSHCLLPGGDQVSLRGMRDVLFLTDAALVANVTVLNFPEGDLFYKTREDEDTEREREREAREDMPEMSPTTPRKCYLPFGYHWSEYCQAYYGVSGLTKPMKMETEADAPTGQDEPVKETLSDPWDEYVEFQMHAIDFMLGQGSGQGQTVPPGVTQNMVERAKSCITEERGYPHSVSRVAHGPLPYNHPLIASYGVRVVTTKYM